MSRWKTALAFNTLCDTGDYLKQNFNQTCNNCPFKRNVCGIRPDPYKSKAIIKRYGLDKES
ncbi:hypothetical protein KNT80_gp11 [Vibrio phage 1.245.O._10N.261.54.C7]|uniref:Uncharacterized protein n=1 Tax=Vibrio phage 1.245.O._10N.261.54.C7 TaxID=1881236 RepID=A0A2I7RWB0_9CAUD|nr:hypothetical protein KNT80_gp11 [Vibrio phage 1.245.O._10N.261.54.C7]AUR97924.1 hypothetical protein NVP1245O_11 [Vibrio phage 1.245.O._10N.261.54.C7]